MRYFRLFLHTCILIHVYNSICDASWECGYGRVYIPEPSYSLKGKIYLYEAEFQKIHETANEIRQRVGDPRKLSSETHLTLSTFSFTFFNQEGDLVEERLPLRHYFFGHQRSLLTAEPELLNEPHFFLSGRHAEEDLQELGQRRHRVSSLYEINSHSFFRASTEIEKIKIPLQFPCSSILLKSLKEIYKKEWEKEWENHINKSPFEKIFVDHMVSRLRNDNKRVAEKFKDRDGNRHADITQCKSKKLSASSSCLVPGKGKEQTEGDEGLFVHAEQLAMARMKQELPDFLDLIKNYIVAEQVHYVVLNIYTRNTMCARCAMSLEVDYENYLKALLEGKFLRPILFRILAWGKVPCKTTFRGPEKEAQYLYYDSETLGIPNFDELSELKIYHWMPPGLKGLREEVSAEGDSSGGAGSSTAPV